MALCKICGKRYWFFSHHQCPVKPRQTSSSTTRSYNTNRSIISDSNDLYLQQQLLQQMTASSNEESCRSTPIEVSGSFHGDSTNVTTSNHCHSSNDPSNSYSSETSSSSYDSGSSSSSSWD